MKVLRNQGLLQTFQIKWLTVWMNYSSDLKSFAISRPSASNFKSFSLSLEQFYLAVGQKNIGNKIPRTLISISFFKEMATVAYILHTTYFGTCLLWREIDWKFPNSQSKLQVHFITSLKRSRWLLQNVPLQTYLLFIAT